MRGGLILPRPVDAVDEVEGFFQRLKFLRSEVFARGVTNHERQVVSIGQADSAHQLFIDEKAFLKILRSELVGLQSVVHDENECKRF